MSREDQHESSSTTVVHSSIALLQERFRQLQRVKEMREERALKRMLTEPKHKQLDPNPTMHYVQPSSRLYSDSELSIPPRSPPHVALSIWPQSQTNHADYTSSYSQNQLFVNSCPTDHRPSALTSFNKFNDSDSHSDVDTSLHL